MSLIVGVDPGVRLTRDDALALVDRLERMQSVGATILSNATAAKKTLLEALNPPGEGAPPDE